MQSYQVMPESSDYADDLYDRGLLQHGFEGRRGYLQEPPIGKTLDVLLLLLHVPPGVFGRERDGPAPGRALPFPSFAILSGSRSFQFPDSSRCCQCARSDSERSASYHALEVLGRWAGSDGWPHRFTFDFLMGILTDCTCDSRDPRCVGESIFRDRPIEV